MNNYDQRANDRADQHLNMMHKGSEYDAMKGLAGSKADAARDALRERNAQSRLDEQLRKQRKNDELLRKAKMILALIAIAIVAYTLIHFL